MMNKEQLRASEDLAKLDDSQLEFLIDRGELLQLKRGEYLFERGHASDHFYLILKGKVRVYLIQKDQQREVALLMVGDITGVLPYSRMTHAQASGQALEDTEVFTLHRRHFRDMIVDYHELTEALVHHMASRIRSFTAMRMQNEKLISLGKLSAGLAHELNNPAAAMVRSSESLLKHLKLVPDKFKKVMLANIKPEVVEEVNDWLFDLISKPKTKLSLMQKNALEDELADELEACDINNPYDLAEDLVDFNISPEDISNLKAKTGEEGFQPTLLWIVNNLATERIVEEINTSAKRIAELISSIKEYSHMDRNRDKQLLNINDGIESTITMLKHKAVKNNVKIDAVLDDDLPKITGYPGELKQVWTNLIDNAFDAMEAKGGTLSIESKLCEPYVMVTIGDTGSGIPDDIKDSIFDPFFTTKDVGKGTGLGLDIVAKIIEQHRGKIEVNSKPGETKFEVCIPLNGN